MASPTQSQRALKLTTALGDEVLLIEKIFGEEALGQPFQYTVTAVSEGDDFSFDDLLGTVAMVELDQKQSAGTPRFFHGVVSQISHAGYSPAGHSRYELLLVPWLDLARRSSGCKIFQQMTVPEILEDVFGKYSGTYELKLSESYPTRDYCVQYRESDFNFVQRLMEHEGIYYYWEHTQGGYQMILCDSMSTHESVSGYEEVIYRAHDSGVQEENVLTSWSVRHLVTPGVYVMNSYNFESPAPSPNTKLLSKDDKPHSHAQGDWEVYDNPVDYGELSDGERLARIRREEAQVDTKSVVVQTNARGLFPGSVFTPLEVPREDQSGKKYLITAHSFSAEAGLYGVGSGSAGDTYQVTLSAIPVEGCIYRSRRIAIKPTVQGVQTALVSGPAGEEIFVDEYGRVKVQFHWDREGSYDDGTSCWIRVSQVWAGGGWGGMAIPRIGQEVIVDFIEGNPDSPIITGRVYNGESTVPYSLPADMTKTTIKSNSSKGGGGSNELRFEDKKGSEEVYIHAEKDQNNIVKNNETTQVGNDRTENIGNDETITIGNDRTETVGNNENVSIGNNQVLTVGNSRTKQVGVGGEHVVIAGHKEEAIALGSVQAIGINSSQTIGMDSSISVGKNCEITVGKDETIDVGKNFTINAGDSITLKTGKASIVMKKNGDITIKGKNLNIKTTAKMTAKASGNIILKGKKILEN